MAALIAYFSRAGENYFSGKLRTVPVGNTETVAETLADLTGAERFKIEMAAPYAQGYNECIEEARADQRRDARPELRACPDSLDAYDIIYLGYPNYWGTMPMAVFTFLERYNFDGKVIYPFCTHEGSGLGRSEEDIRRLSPGAKVEAGLAIQGGRAKEARAALERWLHKN